MGLFSHLVHAVTSPIRAVFGGDDKPVKVQTATKTTASTSFQPITNVSTNVDLRPLAAALAAETKAELQIEQGKMALASQTVAVEAQKIDIANKAIKAGAIIGLGLLIKGRRK